jgi:hypothetical protein
VIWSAFLPLAFAAGWLVGLALEGCDRVRAQVGPIGPEPAALDKIFLSTSGLLTLFVDLQFDGSIPPHTCVV